MKPTRLIYELQMGQRELEKPFSYIPDDISYRSPWFVGPREPPLRILFPIVMENGKLDPYAIFVGFTEGGKPFAYTPRLVVNPLMLVVGLPGAGKSATLMTMIYSFIANEPISEMYGLKHPTVVVVDPEGEYHVLQQLFSRKETLVLKLGRRDYINILDRPSKTIMPMAWYMRMLATIQKFLEITPARAPQAYRALKFGIISASRMKGFSDDPSTWYREDITMEDVYRVLEEKRDELENKQRLRRSESMLLQGIHTVLSRLDHWMVPPNDAFMRRSTIELSSIFRYRLVVLDVRGLSKDLFGLFTYWIVYWFYGFMLEKGPLPQFGIRVILVLDEAWALLRRERREENPLEGLVRRARKYGIMTIVATQTPEDVDEKLFSMFGTMVVGQITSEKMVEKLVESRAMPARFKEKIKMLERGWLVWSIAWVRRDFPMSGEPLVVRTSFPLATHRLHFDLAR